MATMSTTGAMKTVPFYSLRSTDSDKRIINLLPSEMLLFSLAHSTCVSCHTITDEYAKNIKRVIYVRLLVFT